MVQDAAEQVVFSSQTSDDYKDKLLINFLQSLEGLDAIHAWHVQVQKHHSERLFLRSLEGLSSTRDGNGLNVVCFHHPFQSLPHHFFVIDDQYSLAGLVCARLGSCC